MEQQSLSPTRTFCWPQRGGHTLRCLIITRSHPIISVLRLYTSLIPPFCYVLFTLFWLDVQLCTFLLMWLHMKPRVWIWWFVTRCSTQRVISYSHKGMGAFICLLVCFNWGVHFIVGTVQRAMEFWTKCAETSMQFLLCLLFSFLLQRF